MTSAVRRLTLEWFPAAPGSRCRGGEAADLGAEPVDGGVGGVDAGQHLADQQAVVGAEAADQCLLELGELGAQATLGQLGQQLGVVHAGDQGRQHRPAGDPQDVAGHPRQLGCRRPPAACSSRWAWRVRSWITVLR
jgi:hypothetical protein